jgi:hypothetical protein
MNPEIKAGIAIKAKYTETNRNCGIDPESARGFICKADEAGVSIYLDKAIGKGWIEARMSLDTFAMNFEIDGWLLTPASAYIRSSHYSKVFPDSFM